MAKKDSFDNSDDLLGIDELPDMDDLKNDESLLNEEFDGNIDEKNMLFWRPEEENDNITNKKEIDENENSEIQNTNLSDPTKTFSEDNRDNNVELESHLEIEIQVGKDHEILHEDEEDDDEHKTDSNNIIEEKENSLTDKASNVVSTEDTKIEADDQPQASTQNGISDIETNPISTITSNSLTNDNKRKHSFSPILWNESNSTSDATNKKAKTAPTKDRESRLKYIFRSARFFLIKSNNHENVALAKQKEVWSTPPQNETRLNQAFKQCANVILVFSVTESGRFQGFARLASESDKDHPPVKWVLPLGLEHRIFTSVFKLDWISKNDLDFHETMNLKNPWNSNRPVKIGRDGQEIEPTVGETLCRMFPEDASIDLHRIASLAKHSLRKAHIQASSSNNTPYSLSSAVSLPASSDLYASSSSTLLSNNLRETRCDDGNRRKHGDRRQDGYGHRNKGESEGDGIPVRYGVRREVLLNGSYSDYVREFTSAPVPQSNPPYIQQAPPVYMYDRNVMYTAPNPTIDYQPNPYSYSGNTYLNNQTASNAPSSGLYMDTRTVHYNAAPSYRNNYDYRQSRSHYR